MRRERKEYFAWHGMKKRCLDPRDRDFHRYGGRGITVCDRWLGEDGFKNFLADVGPRPPGKTIDRWPDNNGNYEPGNVRWATPREQVNNRGNTTTLELNGRRQPLTDWARELGISRRTLDARLRYGWSDERVLTAPIDHRRNWRLHPMQPVSAT